MDRRTFLQTSIAAATAAATGGSSRAAETHHITKVGLQLYTVRDLMQKDFDGTIARVAQTGYTEVEFAGYFGRTPEQVRAVLQQNGLTSPSTHIDYENVENKWAETLQHAKIIINTSRLKKRVPLYKRQTASRRSVGLKNVRDLHYADAALLF